MLHENLTERILKACFDVAAELGAGFLESVYQKALMVALEQDGLNVKMEVPLRVKYRNIVVGEFYADLLVEEKIIIEIKTAKDIASEHQAQVINYLKGTGIEVGLLVNFGSPRLQYKRLERRLDFHE